MTFRVIVVDGPRRDADQDKFIYTSDTSAPRSGDAFELDGTTYTFTGTVQADPDGHDRYHATKDSVELFLWFKGLRSSTRLALLANPKGPVPSGVVAELAASAHGVSAAYWPGHSEPDGFHLAGDVEQWLKEHKPLSTIDLEREADAH